MTGQGSDSSSSFEDHLRCISCTDEALHDLKTYRDNSGPLGVSTTGRHGSRSDDGIDKLWKRKEILDHPSFPSRINSMEVNLIQSLAVPWAPWESNLIASLAYFLASSSSSLQMIGESI
jgi:hypothetical protein